MKGAYDDKTDEELVKLALQKQEHFVYLINRYQHKLLRYIKRISNFSVEETEDILQEVFIKVYRNLEGFDQSLKFSSWIYRIAHNQTISHFRKSRAGPNLVNPQTAEKLFKKHSVKHVVMTDPTKDLLELNVDDPEDFNCEPFPGN